jgi:hypothetical protein
MRTGSVSPSRSRRQPHGRPGVRHALAATRDVPIYGFAQHGGAARMKTIYFVIGGIFTNSSFEKLEPNGQEMHGPFLTEREAEDMRQRSTGRNFDICWHKVFIVPVLVPAMSVPAVPASV